MPLQERNVEHNYLHGVDLLQNSYAAWHEPLGDFGVFINTLIEQQVRQNKLWEPTAATVPAAAPADPAATPATPGRIVGYEGPAEATEDTDD